MKKIIAIAALSCITLNATGCISPDVLLQANQIMQNAPTVSEVETTETVTEKETPKQEPVTVEDLIKNMDFFKSNCYYDLSLHIGREVLDGSKSLGETEIRYDITHIKYDNIVYGEGVFTIIDRYNIFGVTDEAKIKEYNVYNDDGTMYDITWVTGDDRWDVTKKNISESPINENDKFLVYEDSHFKDAYIEETDDFYIIKNVGVNSYIKDLIVQVNFCEYDECGEKIKIDTSIYFDKKTKEVKEIVAEINFALLNAYHWNNPSHLKYNGLYVKGLPSKIVVNNIKERTKEIPLPTNVELK